MRFLRDGSSRFKAPTTLVRAKSEASRMLLSTCDSAPNVRNLAAIRGDPVLIRIAVFIEFRRNVDYQGFILADAFEAVIHVGRDLQHHLIMRSHEKFIDLAKSGRVFSSVIEDDLHHAMDNNKMIPLSLMIMPA